MQHNFSEILRLKYDQLKFSLPVAEFLNNFLFISLWMKEVLASHGVAFYRILNIVCTFCVVQLNL